MKKFDLTGTWNMSGNGFNTSGTIPGSVYSFLLDNELIPDPYYRNNESEALELMEHTYTFQREFDYTMPDSPVLLHCDGLDTLCTIYINDTKIASTKNMHRTYEFDVTHALLNGKNTISLEFASANKYFKEKIAEEKIACCRDALYGHSHLRKAECMSGWDWGPKLPDAGIWRDIYLLAKDSARIDDVKIVQEHTDGKVFVTALVKTDLPAAICVTVTAPDGYEFTIPANEKTEIKNPRLWWPNNLGEQALYTFTIELTENGVIIDSIQKRIGLRTLLLIREKDRYGESFCHEINGVRFFAMGADYVPEDNLLSRITPDRTRTLLSECKRCNFNAVRVWGGGYYPDDFFFDICDELGLVVFQDMMFACMEVSKSPEMFEEIRHEITDNLLRIRHHASLAIISGNNEMEGTEFTDDAHKEVYLDVFEGLIPDIVASVCPEIPYIPSSPVTCGHFIDSNNENYGDSHYWEIWFGGIPFTDYRKHYFRYLSEFGFESFPSEKTINSVTLPEDRNIFSRVMEMHQRSVGANKRILTYLADTFLYPTEFGTLLYASQLLQAEAIRYAVEHLRRNRGRCMGTLYWQLNDIWPVASWASIDYYGRYKALQYVAKRFYAPLMISCEETGELTSRLSIILEGYDNYETKARLNVTNETKDTVSGIVNWYLRSTDGNTIDSGECSVTVDAFSSVWLDEMDFNKTDVNNNYLYYSFTSDGMEISSGSVIFTLPKYFQFKNPNLRYEINGGEITVFADSFAKYVEIDSPSCDFILSDNYFDMEAGSKTVKVISGTPQDIRLRSIYDIR